MSTEHRPQVNVHTETKIVSIFSVHTAEKNGAGVICSVVIVCHAVSSYNESFRSC